MDHANHMASLEASLADKIVASGLTILCNLEHHETALVASGQWICMYPYRINKDKIENAKFGNIPSYMQGFISEYMCISLSSRKLWKFHRIRKLQTHLSISYIALLQCHHARKHSFFPFAKAPCQELEWGKVVIFTTCYREEYFCIAFCNQSFIVLGLYFHS